MIKLPGIPTGTVDAVTRDGERALWRPHGDLTLLVSETCSANLPDQIKGNPDAATLIRMRDDQEKYCKLGMLGKFLSWVRRKAPFPPVRESARMFVGHNVGEKQFWRSGQVYLMGYLLREEQLRNGKGVPAFSFYVGVGAFPGTGDAVTAEESSQFVFMNFGQSRKAFLDDMAKLAQALAEALSQESVLLEFSEEGRVALYDYVEADRKNWVSTGDAEKMLEENSYRIPKKVWER